MVFNFNRQLLGVVEYLQLCRKVIVSLWVLWVVNTYLSIDIVLFLPLQYMLLIVLRSSSCQGTTSMVGGNSRWFALESLFSIFLHHDTYGQKRYIEICPPVPPDEIKYGFMPAIKHGAF